MYDDIQEMRVAELEKAVKEKQARVKELQQILDERK